MSGVFQTIDPPPPPLTARRVCGEDTLAGWEGGGGQYFGRRQTLLCTLRTFCIDDNAHEKLLVIFYFLRQFLILRHPSQSCQLAEYSAA
jgi:hypothetical protein